MVEPTIARIVERSMRLKGLPYSGGAERIDVITVMRYRELLPADLDSL